METDLVQVVPLSRGSFAVELTGTNIIRFSNRCFMSEQRNYPVQFLALSLIHF